jgi:glycosyltransferase involved in cell wall biosynthesis
MLTRWHSSPSATLAGGRQPTALVVDRIYPRADRDSGSLSILSHVRLLAELGFRVVFVAVKEFASAPPGRAALEAAGVTCAGAERYASIEALLEAEGRGIAVCVLCRVGAGGRYIEAVPRACPAAKVIFNPVDLHWLRFQRAAELVGDPAAMKRAVALKRRELALVRQSDASVVVSDVEKRILEDAVAGARVWHLPLIRECAGRAAPFESRSGIGFIGNFGHAPNVDAVRHFLSTIWPLVRKRLPRVRLFIVGPSLPEEFQGRNDGVDAIGHVPDLAPVLARMRLTVAPLRYGAGAKGKVVSSLAHGVPCVVSEIGAEGMELVDGRHVLIGCDPGHFADQIVRLHEDAALWRSLSDAGLALVESRHSFAAGRARMQAMLQSLGLDCDAVVTPAPPGAG